MLKLARLARNAFSRDIERRLRALNMIAKKLIPDYRLTYPQLDWWNDAEFNAYPERFCDRDLYNTHRKFMVRELTKLAKDVPGDTAECGVYLGASSWPICEQLGRTHHLFDSFEGVSRPGEKDGDFWSTGALAMPEARALEMLEPFRDRIVVHKGWIPERFPDVAERPFAFVHLDVDLYQPTLDSIAFFYPRMSPGGVIVCDDYGMTTCPGATEAIDEYMADKPEPIVGLDAGGCFIIKR
jgi:hypothetical protein